MGRDPPDPPLISRYVLTIQRRCLAVEAAQTSDQYQNQLLQNQQCLLLQLQPQLKHL